MMTMELSLLLSCFLITTIFLFTLFHFFNPHPKNQTTTHQHRHHKSYAFIGVLFQVIRNRNRFFDWTTEILTDNPTHTVALHIPFFPTSIITANPKNVEYILKTNFDNYPRSEHSMSLLEDFLGHGIFISNGEHWHWQRKVVSLAFTTRTLRGFMVETVHSEIMHRLIPLLEKTINNGEVIEMQDVLERFAFDNLSRVVFDVDLACLSEGGSDFLRYFTETINLIFNRFPIRFVWRVIKWLDIGSEKRLRQSIARIKNHVTGIIQGKIEKPSNNKTDIISQVVLNRQYTMENLVDIVTNLLLAGKETTSAALTWFFWLLANRPDVEGIILEEIRSIRSRNTSSNAMFGYNELKDMYYLHAAITESMRLYPPVAIDMVACKEDDILPDGTILKKGWLVGYQAYAMGRMEDIWGRDCSEYKPERWLDENGVFRPESPFKYPVFHAGPRMCLGKDMAYIQMKSIAASLLERYEIEAVMEGVPSYLTGATLKMKGGLQVRFKKREHHNM